MICFEINKSYYFLTTSRRLAQMTRITRQSGSRTLPIDLTQIKYNSTCLALSLPKSLCCDFCAKKIDASIGLSKKSSTKSKVFRNCNDRYRCQQIWLSKYNNSSCRTTTVQMHTRVRRFIGLALDVDIVHEYKYKHFNSTQIY